MGNHSVLQFLHLWSQVIQSRVSLVKLQPCSVLHQVIGSRLESCYALVQLVELLQSYILQLFSNVGGSNAELEPCHFPPPPLFLFMVKD